MKKYESYKGHWVLVPYHILGMVILVMLTSLNMCLNCNGDYEIKNAFFENGFYFLEHDFNSQCIGLNEVDVSSIVGLLKKRDAVETENSIKYSIKGAFCEGRSLHSEDRGIASIEKALIGFSELSNIKKFDYIVDVVGDKRQKAYRKIWHQDSFCISENGPVIKPCDYLTVSVLKICQCEYIEIPLMEIGSVYEKYAVISRKMLADHMMTMVVYHRYISSLGFVYGKKLMAHKEYCIYKELNKPGFILQKNTDEECSSIVGLLGELRSFKGSGYAINQTKKIGMMKNKRIVHAVSGWDLISLSEYADNRLLSNMVRIILRIKIMNIEDE